MNPIYDFRDQVALVTGGDSGIGLAAAQAFAEAGAAVVLAALNEEGLQAAADALVAAGHQAIGVRCDVSNESQVAELTDRTVATLAGSTWRSTTPESRCPRATPLTSLQRRSTT